MTCNCVCQVHSLTANTCRPSFPHLILVTCNYVCQGHSLTANICRPPKVLFYLITVSCVFGSCFLIQWRMFSNPMGEVVLYFPACIFLVLFFHLWLSLVWANERRHYICNVFSHWLWSWSAIDRKQILFAMFRKNYCQTSNISRTLVNKIVDHSDVVGASPVGAAPTSSFST